MATRIICDQCGNTISGQPFKFSVQAMDDNEQSVRDQLQIALASMRGAVSPPPISRTYTPPIIVELCTVCKGTWLERVKNLTKASEPG